MNPVIVVLQVFAMTFNSNSNTGNDTLITADTQPPVLLESAGTSDALPEDEYRKLADQLSKSSHFVRILQKPKQLSTKARFGSNLLIGELNTSWILDGDEKQGYILYADLNANGNLGDDSPLQFGLDKGKYSVMLKTVVTEKFNGNEGSYPVQRKLEVDNSIPSEGAEPQLALNEYFRTRRSGVIQVGQRKMAFALTGDNGIYDFDYNGVSFDLTGDGELSPSESYAVREKYVNIGDSSYEFRVDRYGRRLSLKLLSTRFPDRPSLQPGSQAPEATFKDLSGSSHRLSDYRGKVLLLDFWGVWCGPCVAEVLGLVTTYQQLHKKGFEIIGIHNGKDTSTVRKFISERGMNWTQTIEEESGAIQRLFRINGWPTYYLIGKDGNILTNNLRPGESLTKEIEKQFQEK